MLLVDEVDRVELETEALLLEILSEYQVSIPELGTVRATQLPMVFLTSNNTRELSEALKRRCLYLHIDYPDLDREREIVRAKVPGISEELADQVARIVRSLRTLELRKAPSVSETLDWARTLVLLGVRDDRRRRREGHAAHPVEVPGRHRAGLQGAAVGLVGLSAACSTSSPASSPSCAAPGCPSRSPSTSTPPRRSSTSRSRTARP